MIPTHAVTLNGRTSFDLAGPSDGTIEQELRDLLTRLNGGTRYSLVLWRLPDGVTLDEVEPNDDAMQRYIQCAGDFNGRLTAEVRELVQGVAHQYVLGRARGARDSAPADQAVHWNDHDQHVRSNEVLSGAEVAELFVHYYRSGTTPDDYSRREIQP